MLASFYRLLRPFLFAFDAEAAHNLTFALLAAGGRPLARLLGGRFLPHPTLRRHLGPLEIAGPVGLAAGLDKDGVAIPLWAALGFGFIEVGTVTAHPQPGNPRPRLFRLPADRALINRLGFNNRGSAALAERLRHLRKAGAWPQVPVGVNLGKSKVTPVEEAAGDYVTSVERLVGLADAFTINVSSPNTPGLRSLQEREALAGLLGPVIRAAGKTPVFLKLAPDLEQKALADAVEVALEQGAAGLIATNTTVSRPGLRNDPGEGGGLSGRPLWPLARRKIAEVLEAAAGQAPVVGVGGIESAAQVRELLDLGCSAVQLYTALVYQGPGLPARLHADLVED